LNVFGYLTVASAPNHDFISERLIVQTCPTIPATLTCAGAFLFSSGISGSVTVSLTVLGESTSSTSASISGTNLETAVAQTQSASGLVLDDGSGSVQVRPIPEPRFATMLAVAGILAAAARSRR
jgi:hypothetical protein